MSDESLALLVVSARPGTARRLASRLGADGASPAVEEAGSWEAAAERLAAGGIDLLLVEELSEEGERLAALLRRFPSLPALVLGEETPEAAERAVRAGAQGVLAIREGSEAAAMAALASAIERQRREWATAGELRRYRLAVRSAGQAIWEWNLRDDRVLYSPEWKGLLGFGLDEVGEGVDEWLGRVHPSDLDLLKREISAYLNRRVERLDNEHRIRDARGRYRWMACYGTAERDANGAVERLVGSLRDVNSRKLKEELLLHDAMHDGLTGIANSALLMDRLAVALAQARRQAEVGFALFFLDLDRFKMVNDNLGHAVGDRLLAAVALRLQTLLRPGDTVARLGGDEFAILAHSVREPSDATRIAERIHEELRRPFHLDEHTVLTSTSVGIALSSRADERPQELLRDADTAMYRAKNMGRARHAIFDEEMHRRAVEFLRMETELSRGIREGELELHYQPIVDLKAGRLSGFEALVRWRHPQRGLLPPGEFISIAEETGLSVPLGWAVLREACGQMATWQRQLPGAGGLTMRVNLSQGQFSHPELVGRLDEILHQTGLDPRLLGLEMSESAIGQSTTPTVERLRRVHDLGVRLHIDDFGTGRISLAFLDSLPAQSLEIDRSLVSRLADEREPPRVLGTIVSLARNLGMEVDVEGLETRAQLAHLRGLDCEYGKGFYFSRPMEQDAARELIARRPSWR
ncbi:MAG: EAL domain-containing protein [Thermoanaerobaculia bacterium]|nr:EAL domain-containing protein [Thermoanaerobaculia bacterium]